MYTWARVISYCRELEFLLWNSFNALGQNNEALEGASLAANACPQNMTCFSKHPRLASWLNFFCKLVA